MSHPVEPPTPAPAPPDPGHCHLCDCVIGWLHNATEHAGPFVAHEPFVEDDCAVCWEALAAGLVAPRGAVSQ